MSVFTEVQSQAKPTYCIKSLSAGYLGDWKVPKGGFFGACGDKSLSYTHTIYALFCKSISIIKSLDSFVYSRKSGGKGSQPMNMLDKVHSKSIAQILG